MENLIKKVAANVLWRGDFALNNLICYIIYR